MTAGAAGAFSPASAAGPAAGPLTGRVFNGLDEASQDALEGIQANGAGQAVSPAAANSPGTVWPPILQLHAVKWLQNVQGAFHPGISG